jgi:glycosyltransferase involved in cell wall biosynthesis
VNKVSCIIASYNEGERVFHVLQALLVVSSISQIIFVDDGSLDDTYLEVKDKFPKVTVIHFMKNQGKTAAVARGLEEAKEKVVFLIDADLENVNSDEIEQGIKKYFSSGIDMLIFQVITTYAKIDGWLNKYIVFSGTRILKKKDLLDSFNRKTNGYQIEAAINQYFIDNKKEVRWIPCSAINPNKFEKLGPIKGLFRNIKMEIGYMFYTNLLDHWKQILFFGREKLQ